MFKINNVAYPVVLVGLASLLFGGGSMAEMKSKEMTASMDAPISYPEGYRSWVHVKSRVNLDGHSQAGNVGFQHVYANASAVAGLKSGKYADGATLVLDRLNYESADDKILSEGSRKALVIMVKDAARYTATGGWGFEGFKAGDPNQRIVKDDGVKCFSCHEPLKKDDFVFTKWRD